MKLMDKAKQAALAAAVKTGLSYLEKDPEVNIPKLMELVDKFVPDGWYESQRNAIRNAIQNKDSNWYKLILRIYELDPGVREAFFTNFIINASLKGSALQEETAEENNCNVPWAILLDPTSACNLHCTGCWAAEYGHKLNLDFDTICSIVEQGRKMGTYMYIYTGGEPLVRKKDLMRICEKYPDCEFLSFTNGTLIDEEFCQEMLRVKNFVPAISLEGSEEANDGRRAGVDLAQRAEYEAQRQAPLDHRAQLQFPLGDRAYGAACRGAGARRRLAGLRHRCRGRFAQSRDGRYSRSRSADPNERRIATEQFPAVAAFV